MKYCLFLLTVLFFCTTSKASENNDAVRTRLCDYWRYDFESGSYGCGFLSLPVNLVEAKQVDEVVAKLEKRIATLEKKIEELEKNH